MTGLVHGQRVGAAPVSGMPFLQLATVAHRHVSPWLPRAGEYSSRYHTRVPSQSTPVRSVSRATGAYPGARSPWPIADR